MKNINMIACISENYGLGLENQLLWHFKEDMKFFRKMTKNHTIVMGRKTFESLPGLLPYRKHIVLSKTMPEKEGITLCKDKDMLDNELEKLKEEAFIIGGASLYKMYLLEAKKLYLTEVKGCKMADTYFPEFDKDLFDDQILLEGQEENIPFVIHEYSRKLNKE